MGVKQPTSLHHAFPSVLAARFVCGCSQHDAHHPHCGRRGGGGEYNSCLQPTRCSVYQMHQYDAAKPWHIHLHTPRVLHPAVKPVFPMYRYWYSYWCACGWQAVERNMHRRSTALSPACSPPPTIANHLHFVFQAYIYSAPLVLGAFGADWGPLQSGGPLGLAAASPQDACTGE
jgi:hypothetical protein